MVTQVQEEALPENTRQQVQEFYDQVGWSRIGDGLYQNSRYEDLRPVVREYIHKCHLRVNRYLDPRGEMLLDAGSGPVQWPEYLSYSEGYRFRVCADLSITALREARQRLGEKGLYIVMDIAHLPFKSQAFDGLVSLHTIHHLPPDQHATAYSELYRVLKPGKRGVAVNGWGDSAFIRATERLSTLMRAVRRPRSRNGPKRKADSPASQGTGTYIHKSDASGLRGQLKGLVPIEIYCWRSVDPRFTRRFIRAKAGGKTLLRMIYWLEERFPRFMGENGRYPLIAFRKS